MREIEVKARLIDKDGFLKTAKELGIEFGTVVSQDDATYENELPYDDPDWNIFRLRKQDGKLILTMKHKASTRSRDNHEYETSVENEAEMVKMLNRLGFTHGIRVKKQRRVAHYNGLEICMDEIDELGCFVEAEKLAEDTADVDSIQSELWDVLLKLGVHPDDRVHLGYDMLMRQYRSEAE